MVFGSDKIAAVKASSQLSQVRGCDVFGVAVAISNVEHLVGDLAGGGIVPRGVGVYVCDE